MIGLVLISLVQTIHKKFVLLERLRIVTLRRNTKMVFAFVF